MADAEERVDPPLAENGLPLMVTGAPLPSAERDRLVRSELADAAGASGDDAVSAVAAALTASRERICASFAPGRGWELIGRLAAVADAAVGRLVLHAQREAELDHCPVAVVATGGYGRAVLFPWSDVDLTIVPAAGPSDALDCFIRTLHRVVFDCLQDRAKLSVGYQFRLLDDLGHVDHKTATTLLDARLVCGDKEVFARFTEAWARSHDRATMLLGLVAEREERGLGRGGQVYRLEPDLKSGPGGLRDLEFALWIGRLAMGLDRPLTVEALGERGLLTDEQLGRVWRAFAALCDLRFALHLSAGRKMDTLYLSQHDSVAGVLFPGSADPLDALMRARFASAAEIHAVAEHLVEASVAMQTRLRGPLALRNGRVTLAADVGARAPREAVLGPGDALEAVLWHAKTGAPLSQDLQREVASAGRHVRPVQPGEGSSEMLALLDSPRAPSALRLLRDLGLMGRLVPETAASIGRLPRDPSHEHSICEHSLRVVETLFRLSENEGSAPASLQRQWMELGPADRRALTLAAWLHDMGKPDGAEAHAEVGARICRAVAARLGLPRDEAELAARLVELHLAMARTSRTLDLDQEVTIRRFATLVGDARTLNLLYVLTYADTKCVGLGVYGDIERRLLEDLYVRTLAVLAEEGMPESDLRAAAERVAARAVRDLRVKGVSDDRVREHCEQMEPLYVVSTPLPLMGMHIAMVRDLTARHEPVVHFYTEPGSSYTEVTICCYDDPEPGLFSKIAGTLFAMGIDIHSAQIRTRMGRQRIVLDTLAVDLQGRALPPDLEERVGANLKDVLLGRTSVRDLLIRRGRRLADDAKIHEVAARNDLSDAHTVVWVTAEDSVGLLYRLTSALAMCGLNLHTAKITTWGARAEDVFYVSGPEGTQVPTEELEATVEAFRRAVSAGPS